MSWRVVLSRLLASFQRRRLDQELRAELNSHLAEATEEYQRQGMTQAEAARAAALRLGGTTQIEEIYRDHRSVRWLDDLAGDLRQGIRSLRRGPAFSLTVLLVMAIGVGTITAIFALLNAIVLRPLPFPNASRLVTITHTGAGLTDGPVGLTSGLYQYYTESATSLEGIGTWRENQPLSLRSEARGAERIEVSLTSSGLMTVLGVQPILGRLFSVEDARQVEADRKAPAPIILSEALWRERFGGDRDILGRPLTLSDRPYRVVGVLPPSFRFPDAHTQAWSLLDATRDHPDFAQWFGFHALGRLRPGASIVSATQELRTILPGVVGRYADATPARVNSLGLTPHLATLKESMIADLILPLWTLFGAMAVLLLIAGANVAGLFLIRTAGRRGEIAIRVALGAGRLRVMRLFLIEALILMGVAAVVGVAFAKVILGAILRLVPIELPRATEVSLDARSLLFVALVAVVLALLYSAVAGWHRDESPGAALVGGNDRVAGRRIGRLGREPFVVAQVALAVTLLAGSLLMVRTYWNLSQLTLGFAPAQLVTIDVALSYRRAEHHLQAYHEMLRLVRSVPGVTGASAASFAPLAGVSMQYSIAGMAKPVPFKFVMPGYFRVIGSRVVEGAAFDEGVPLQGSHPVLVSRTLAERLYPGQSALGQQLVRRDENDAPATQPPYTISGIVEDVREVALRDSPAGAVYLPMMAPAVEVGIIQTEMTVFVHLPHPTAAQVAELRRAILAADPGLTVGRVSSMEDIVERARGREVFVGTFLLFAAAISLLLGTVGVYGSVAQTVQRRTREIGIRVALGAQRPEVFQAIVGGSLRSVAAGVTIGLAVSLATTRLLAFLLYGVSAQDPVVYLVAAGSLLAAAGGAGVLAARAGVRIQPAAALRNQHRNR